MVLRDYYTAVYVSWQFMMLVLLVKFTAVFSVVVSGYCNSVSQLIVCFSFLSVIDLFSSY